MVYLAIDKNKKEWAFSSVPEKLTSQWKSPIIGRHKHVPIRKSYMPLQKGTIEKLLGKPLTFEDGYVQFDNWKIFNVETPKCELTKLTYKEDILEDYSSFDDKKTNKAKEPYKLLIIVEAGCYEYKYRFKESEKLQANYTYNYLKENFSKKDIEILNFIEDYLF